MAPRNSLCHVIDRLFPERTKHVFQVSAVWKGISRISWWLTMRMIEIYSTTAVRLASLRGQSWIYIFLRRCIRVSPFRNYIIYTITTSSEDNATVCASSHCLLRFQTPMAQFIYNALYKPTPQ